MTDFSADELFTWVKCQEALGPRRPGSAPGKANEDFIFSKLIEFGLSEVRREEIPLVNWEVEACSFFLEGAEVDAFPIPYCAFTPEGGIEAPLCTSTENPREKIVVAEIAFPPLNPGLLQRLALGKYDPDDSLKEVNHPATWVRLGWHLYQWASKQGAVAFVGILKDQPGGSCRMYAPYGFREKNILDKPLPGIWVSKHQGDSLLESAQAGKDARLIITGKSQPSFSSNIVGEIPGRGEETIVLSTHHDSPFASPVEDASGVAVVLALARYFAERKSLRHRVVVLFTAGHFYGSIGTRSFIQKHLKGITSKTALEISIEHIALEAVENSEGRLQPTGKPEPAGIFVPFNKTVCHQVESALIRQGHGRTLLLPSEGPLGDFPPTDGGDWYEAGVPVINYISNPVYLLTDDDDLAWVDKERLPVVCRLFADLIPRIDELSAKEIRRVDFPVRKFLMKGLKHVLRAKTTCFGRKPIY